MLKILERLTKSPNSAAELAAALAEARQALPDAVDALASAEARRAGLLLTGSDAEVIKAEAQITAARLARDRLEAAIAELERRHDEASQIETTTRLKAEARHLERQAADVANLFEKEALVSLRRAADLFGKLVEHQNAVSTFNVSHSLTPEAPRATQPVVDHRTLILMTEIAPIVARHFSIVAPDRASS